MAKKKHPLAELAIDDPAGAEWQEMADAAWASAEQKAERARAKPRKKNEPEPTAIQFYEPVPMPDFAAAASADVKLDPVLGRFVFQEGVIHDVTRATKACRLTALRAGASRQFIHFAHELAGALPEDAEPHDECMGA